MPAPAPADDSHWYGWQILAVDGIAAAATTSVIVASGEDPRVSMTTFSAAVPVAAVAAVSIHLAHHNPGRALADLALRVVLPGLGFAAGVVTSTCPPGDGNYPECQIGGRAAAGALVGAAVAEAIDAGLFAYGAPAGEAPRVVTPALAPSISVTPTSISASVAFPF